MEPITISKLIQELSVLKQMHGDLKVYNIVYGNVEQIYAVKVDILLKKDTKNEIKGKEQVVLLY